MATFAAHKTSKWCIEPPICMKYFLFAFLCACFVVACSGGDEGGSKAPKDGSGGKGPGGRGAREVAVEVYIATLSEQAREYQTMATLVPMNSVALSAATSGRLVKLSAKDGAQVQKGSLLAKIDDSELRAQLKQAESNKALAEQRYNRTKNLFEKDGATKEDLEAAEASLQSAQANTELIKAQIEKTEVRAPFGGKLGFVDVSVGAWLTAGARVAELSEVNRLKAVFALPQRFASAVKVGDAVEVLDQERNFKKDGKVKALDATISESSRTRQIMVEVDNAKGELLAGGFAKVTVPLTQHSVPVMSVPSEALTLDKDGAYVFVVKGGKATVKRVETGLRTPIAVNVTAGLDEGDSVITSGLISLREGSAVRVREIRHSVNYEVE